MLSRVGNQVRRSCCAAGGGAVYEVSIKFRDAGIRDDYYNWLASRHIKEVLQCDGFVSAELFREHGGCDGLVVRYQLESTEVYDKYNRSDTAKRLREEAIGKFGSKFEASRRVLVNSDIFFK